MLICFQNQLLHKLTEQQDAKMLFYKGMDDIVLQSDTFVLSKSTVYSFSEVEHTKILTLKFQSFWMMFFLSVIFFLNNLEMLDRKSVV